MQGEWYDCNRNNYPNEEDLPMNKTKSELSIKKNQEITKPEPFQTNKH